MNTADAIATANAYDEGDPTVPVDRYDEAVELLHELAAEGDEVATAWAARHGG